MVQGFMAGGDRYKALGMDYPDVETMCKGQCEGIGRYPVWVSDEKTPYEQQQWQKEHDGLAAHDDGPCDGTHFIVCGDCNGTGKRA
jgi:hypothetical protein